MKKRVFVGCFKQESNSFCPNQTGFESFEKSFLEGDVFVHSGGKAGASVVGIVDTLEKNDIEVIGGVGMFSTSGGPVKQTVVDDFLQKTLNILNTLDEKPDGIVLNLHGATLSESSDDVCGDILAALRSAVGENVPITAGFDLHANMTPKMLKNADAVCGYKTYPHVDWYQTGCRAAEMMVRMLHGGPVRDAAAYVPMTASASGYTTNAGMLNRLMEHGHSMVRDGEILDFSVFIVQPWLDIPGMASCVNVCAPDETAAKKAADSLSRELFALREDIQPKHIMSMEEVVRTALDAPDDTTVILVDSADSPGAGSSGDSAAPLKEILTYRETLRAAAAVVDPKAVEKAFALGVGAVSDFEVGGSMAPEMSAPVLIKEAKVKSLHDGTFIAQGPVERGQTFPMGKTAVLQAGQVLILLTSVSGTHRDMQVWRGFGIEPSVCKLICVKANTSFKAGYSSLKSIICECDTSGSARAVLQSLPYRRIPMPFYPFREITEADIIPAACYRV